MNLYIDFAALAGLSAWHWFCSAFAIAAGVGSAVALVKGASAIGVEMLLIIFKDRS